MERILFDIDRTIFDTKTSGENATRSIGLVTGKNPDEIEKINKEYKRGLSSTSDFDSSFFLREVANQTGTGLQKLTETLFNQKNFVLYPEALAVLKKLFSDDYSLGTFSEGVPEWQMKKLTLTGALDYLDPSLIFIERRKLAPEAIAKIPDGVTVIDDKIEVIATLKQQRPDLELVWINRKDEEKMDGVRTIKSLTELL